MSRFNPFIWVKTLFLSLKMSNSIDYGLVNPLFFPLLKLFNVNRFVYFFFQVSMEGALITNKHVYLLLEYMPNGDLQQFISTYGKQNRRAGNILQTTCSVQLSGSDIEHMGTENP